MGTLFAKIIAGEIPCYKVAEDDCCFAFLDVSPVAKGHTLVIPKMEIDNLFDIDDDTISHLIRFAKKVAKAVKANIDCKKIGMAVIGLDVPHAHIHLVPISEAGDLDFTKERLKMEPDEYTELVRVLNLSFNLL